jgi:hypothetical protein
MWKKAMKPDKVNIATGEGLKMCAYLRNVYSVASGIIAGTTADPYQSSGGTYGMRTAGHGDPGGSYVKLSPQIQGSGNVFYGLKG